MMLLSMQRGGCSEMGVTETRASGSALREVQRRVTQVLMREAECRNLEKGRAMGKNRVQTVNLQMVMPDGPLNHAWKG